MLHNFVCPCNIDFEKDIKKKNIIIKKNQTSWRIYCKYTIQMSRMCDNSSLEVAVIFPDLVWMGDITYSNLNITFTNWGYHLFNLNECYHNSKRWYHQSEYFRIVDINFEWMLSLIKKGVITDSNRKCLQFNRWIGDITLSNRWYH